MVVVPGSSSMVITWSSTFWFLSTNSSGLYTTASMMSSLCDSVMVCSCASVSGVRRHLRMVAKFCLVTSCLPWFLSAVDRMSGVFCCSAGA